MDAVKRREQQELMNFLQARVKKYEDKIRVCQDKIEVQTEKYEQLKAKSCLVLKKYQQLGTLLSEAIEFFVQEEPELVSANSEILLKIDQL